MQVLIAYDINYKHGPVRDALLSQGFLDSWTHSSGEVHNLPETTLWYKDLPNTEVAKELFHTVIRDVNVRAPVGDDPVEIKRFIAVRFGDASGIEGKPYA